MTVAEKGKFRNKILWARRLNISICLTPQPKITQVLKSRGPRVNKPEFTSRAFLTEVIICMHIWNSIFTFTWLILNTKSRRLFNVWYTYIVVCNVHRYCLQFVYLFIYLFWNQDHSVSLEFSMKFFSLLCLWDRQLGNTWNLKLCSLFPI